MAEDRDLELLRQFRRAEAEPPEGLQARVEADVWELILAEEARSAGRSSRSPLRLTLDRWRGGLLRPAVAAGAAVTLAVIVAIASDGGASTGVPTTGTVRQADAGGLDAVATALFGESAAATTLPSPTAGTIHLDEGDADHAVVARGPQLDGSGAALDDDAAETARVAPRDPAVLRDMLHRAAVDAVGADPTDRVAFHLGMQWVVQPAVPTDLRIAMLRSIEGMDGLDTPQTVLDTLGRPGLVVGHFDSSSGLREQYVISIEGGKLLERRAYTTAYVDPACPPGTFTDHAVFDDGTQLDPAGLRFIDWPQVVPTCDPLHG